MINTFIRYLFIALNSQIYWAIEKLYKLLIMLSETGLFTQENITQFAGRIYALLGVFMLFKVSFSLITYVLNPDDLVDKNKGMGKLLQNFFVVLIGIVAVPYVFQAAYNLQSIILKENIIGSLIMGMDESVASNRSYVGEGGKRMSFTTLSAFIRLNPNVVGEECANRPVVKDSYGTASLSEECMAFSEVFEKETAHGETLGNILTTAYYNNDVSYYTTTDIIALKAKNLNGKKEYVFEYNYVLSTLAGAVLFWILLVFCIDIATRSVKLAFLQLVAPIPIISYIDPKSGKDGVFKKWLNQCTKTYLDLFIRLIAIYFVLFVIAIIIEGGIHNVTTGEPQNNALITVLIIFGALMFAKQLPKLISDILGTKLNEQFNLNPVNKLQQIPVVGFAATQILGRGAGAIEAMRHDQTGNKWRAAASGWLAAGDSLKGKVPFMGSKEGAQTVRSIHTGREAGYEVATGSKMRKHSLVNDLFIQDGKSRIQDLKDNYRAPLQQELNNLGLQKQEAANAYNKLNEQLQRATSEPERREIRAKMQVVQKRYEDITKQEAKVSGDIGVINDQIKDLERAYSIDKSPAKKVNEVKARVESGTYHRAYPPIDYTNSEAGTVEETPTSGDSKGSESGGQSDTKPERPQTPRVTSPVGQEKHNKGVIVPDSAGIYGRPKYSTKQDPELLRYLQALEKRAKENPDDEGLQKEIAEVKKQLGIEE